MVTEFPPICTSVVLVKVEKYMRDLFGISTLAGEMPTIVRADKHPDGKLILIPFVKAMERT